MSPSNRMLRVNELLKRELGMLCERFVAPETHALITVTGVRTAPDLRNATVLVSLLGNENDCREALAKLVSSRKELQSALAGNVKLKYTPVLHFKEDHTAEKADRVLAILDELDIADVPADDSTKKETDTKNADPVD